MQKGYSLPIVLFIVVAIVAVPLVLWATGDTGPFSSSNDVQGALIVNEEYADPGLGITVVSSSRTWGLSEYLCKTYEECVSSLESGKKWGTVSGGASDGHFVLLDADPTWAEYEYIKIFVEPSWNSDSPFVLSNTNQELESEVIEFTQGSSSVQALIVSVEQLLSSFYSVTTFTNK